MSIKLLHCADLHLDAVLGNSISASQSEYFDKSNAILLRDAPLLALKNISNTAIKEKVDLVLVAGDIFNMKDDSAMNHRVRSYLLDFFNELENANIKVFIVVGNHDPLKHICEMSTSWPKNVHLFGTNVETINLECRGQSISVHGASYQKTNEDRDLASTFPKAKDTDFNFGLLHTNVGGDLNHSNYAPCNLQTLVACDYDYFALGHIHKRSVLSENPLISYSGNHQAFSAKPSECEAKGVTIIDIESKGASPTINFIETDVVRYINESIEIDNANSVEELNEIVTSELESKYANSEQFILCRLQILVNNFDGTFIDNDDLKNLLNENLPDIAITDLKITANLTKFNEYVEISEYFQCIDQEIEVFDDINYEVLYGKQADKIKNALSNSPITTSNYRSENFDKDVKDYIAKIQNEISEKVR